MTEIVRKRLERNDPELTVYHVTNPKTTDWKSLTGLVAKACNAEIVSLQEWVQSLELFATRRDADLHELPAAGLLDFFRMLVDREKHSMPNVDVTNTQVASPTLREIRPVDEEMMAMWLRQWKVLMPKLAV